LADSEPQITFRGHSANVTSLAVSSSQSRIYSASMDQTVRVWSLPQRERDPYAPFDASMQLACFEGHTDAIWDVSLHPLRPLLATASADGTVKIWNTDELGSPLKLSWGYYGADSEDESKNIVPTSVDVCYSDMRKLAVAWQDSVVKLFDAETGQETLRFKSDDTYGAFNLSYLPVTEKKKLTRRMLWGTDGTPATQINQVVTHPTLPLLITAHEDNYIRIFDLNTGAV
jgi:striatin 1/3/4